MVSIGDSIRLTLNKGTDREGTVTGVTGSLLRVRWSSEEETSVVPAPGTLTVLGRTAGKATRPGNKAAGSRKGTPIRTRTRTSATKKGVSKEAPSTKGGATTPASAGNKLAAKKAPSKKSSGTASKAGTTEKAAATTQVASRSATKKRR